MPKRQATVEIEATVREALPNTMFRVVVADNAPEELRGKQVLCTLSGKMRIYRIRVMPGDQVRIQLTPYDEQRGRIIFRY